MNTFQTIRVASRLPGLSIALLHCGPAVPANDYPVLFLHGSSFPSALAAGFVMNNESWMQHLCDHGYDVYALDFLGYGSSDRYPAMRDPSPGTGPLGRAQEVWQDTGKAVDCIVQRTGKDKVYLVGHSWGGAVAALYAGMRPDRIARLVLFAPLTVRDNTTAPSPTEAAWEQMTPRRRVEAMQQLTPPGIPCRLEAAVLKTWGGKWLATDPLQEKDSTGFVRFPAGPSRDIEDLLHNKPLYDPAAIQSPTLLVRGEWDSWPDNTDAARLLTGLCNAVQKKYAVIAEGTHVMHLEQSRGQLYEEVLRFLSGWFIAS